MKTIGVEDFYSGVAYALEARCLLGLGREAEALPVARGAYEFRHAVREASTASWDHLPGLALTERWDIRTKPGTSLVSYMTGCNVAWS